MFRMACLGLLCAVGAVAAPNILFLLADDQRPDTVSAWGNPHIQTPNLDRLVAEGFSFRRAYCMGSDNGAVCVPSRAMLATGKAYTRLTRDIAGERTLGQVLGENGYTTFATGKWHNERPSWLRSFERGKTVYFGGMSDHSNVPIEELGPDGKLRGAGFSRRFSSALFADSVIEFLEGYDEPAPFFAYVAFTAPHDPRQPPKAYREMYYRSRPPLPPNFLPQHPFQNGHMTGRDEELGPWPRTIPVVSDQLAEYYGMVTHLDDQVGRILAALERTGKAEETYVFYAADHGLAIGSHGLLGKQNVYEHSMGTPLIVNGPDVPAGRSSDALAYLLDLFPTILRLAGVEPAADIDGRDLGPVWKGEKTGVRDTLFLGFKDLMKAVRDDRWKLIRYPQVDVTQLFDLAADPHETVNLAADPTQAERIERMTKTLAGWQRRIGDDDPLSVPNPQPKEIDMTGHKRNIDKWQPMWIVEKYWPEWF